MNIRMGTKGKRPLRSLTPRDKIHAIQRIHDGESKASVARDIGVPESTLRGWCKNEDKLRFMSRQSTTDNLCADALADKLDVSGGGVGGGGGGGGGLLGPPEKRQRLDAALPLNFSNKLKFDELAFKRSPLNGLDYSTNKNLAELGYNGLPVDYAAFNGGVVGAKGKVFGADINRPATADPSLNAISPLSSLTHLSGLTGISQSPLAISFNELTTNLNLLAQLNPGLAAMSGLSSFPGAAGAGGLRNPKPSGQSPRSDSGDRTQSGLSVKNWAKQKPGEAAQGSLNLSIKNEVKGGDIKSPSPSIAPSQLGGPMTLSNLAEDPLLYWLKSQQTMLGLNPLYPPSIPMGVTSPPIRSSTPQHHMNQLAQTPPIPSAPLTPSSTPSGSLDEKNAAWYNWCKAFGASLHTLNPNAATLAALQANSMQQQVANSTAEGDPSNILYSHLTKETETPSVRSLSSNEQNAEADEELGDSGDPDAREAEVEGSGKPEDLSSAGKVMTPSQSPLANSESMPASSSSPKNTEKILDNMLFKMGGSESEGSFQNNNDVSASNNNNNNNNNSNKTDEEEKAKYLDCTGDEDTEAIHHGEKFLQWLENCSNPRVTAVQLMQLRFLIAAIKSGNEMPPMEKPCSRSLQEESEDNKDNKDNKDSKDSKEEEEGSGRGKSRRRK
ncbi:protein distal antenna [Drosophila elegans]|uniref:protein distal antenna n=1 Tax=Drosophila elegans TaxID=30023 RepID=UPI0007E7A0BC|nr:protein distal antenna [Drosophila elegans]